MGSGQLPTATVYIQLYICYQCSTMPQILVEISNMEDLSSRNETPPIPQS